MSQAPCTRAWPARSVFIAPSKPLTRAPDRAEILWGSTPALIAGLPERGTKRVPRAQAFSALAHWPHAVLSTASGFENIGLAFLIWLESFATDEGTMFAFPPE